MKRTYLALIHTDREDNYGISFPDMLGCISAADTLDAVLEMGAEALHLHLTGMLEDGDPLPEPRDIHALRRDPEFAEWSSDAIIAPVTVEFALEAAE